VKIKGEVYWLWRAVDEEGEVLDILMQKHRDTEAAKRFFRKIGIVNLTNGAEVK
jgi:putative transposase